MLYLCNGDFSDTVVTLVFGVNVFEGFLADFGDEGVEGLDVLLLRQLVRVNARRLVHIETAQRSRRFEHVRRREKHT